LLAKGEYKLAKRNFDDIFLESVDEALSSLGDSAKRSVYFHLEDKFGLEKGIIAKKPKELESGLDKIFGAGSKYIEILIMKSLHGKLEHPIEWEQNKELIFVDYVNAAKRSYVRTAAKKSIRASES
jgi:hypothetical protein